MPIAAPVASLVRIWRVMVASHGVRLLVICAGFAMLLVAGFHSGRDFASALQAVFAQGRGQPGIAASRHPRPAPPMEPADPADEFTVGRIGQLLISRHNSDHCLRLLFDNRSGELSDAGKAACGLITEAGDPALDRAEVLRRAFRK